MAAIILVVEDREFAMSNLSVDTMSGNIAILAGRKNLVIEKTINIIT